MFYSIRMRASDKGRHISGAEGIYYEGDIEGQVCLMVKRAFRHTRGKAGKIDITIEELERDPIDVKALPVSTYPIKDTREAYKRVALFLEKLGLAPEIIHHAWALIHEKEMSGASLLDIQTGERLEIDASKGVRVSRLGIRKGFDPILSERLERLKLNHIRIKEALVLASKVAFHPDIIAELCASDDPDYTTGYVASKTDGYVRIPHMKEEGSLSGGRVFFVRHKVDIDPLIHYLEKTPVMVSDAC